jgi:hypothetical protein
MGTGDPFDSPESAQDTDWRRLTELCQAVADELPALAAKITDCIRSEFAVYDSIPFPEHERFVRGQAEALLAGLTARLPPSREQALLARGLGAQRARQGISLDVVLSSYHIGFREIWNELLSRARAQDGELTTALVQLVNLLWNVASRRQRRRRRRPQRDDPLAAGRA